MFCSFAFSCVSEHFSICFTVYTMRARLKPDWHITFPGNFFCEEELFLLPELVLNLLIQPYWEESFGTLRKTSTKPFLPSWHLRNQCWGERCLTAWEKWRGLWSHLPPSAAWLPYEDKVLGSSVTLLDKIPDMIWEGLVWSYFCLGLCFCLWWSRTQEKVVLGAEREVGGTERDSLPHFGLPS